MESDAADVKSCFRLDCPTTDSTKKYRIPPMFRNTTFSPVFHSYERTMDVLNRVSDMPEVQELLAVGRKELPGNFSIESLQSQLKHPFVVVEGMDAAGKTTLTETLERKMQAVRYHTPPPCIQHLRKFFDAMPEIVRRAYYSLGNYVVAIQIAKECQQKAVVMDRFWHSTAAYGIANETSLSDLPPLGHVTYNWPCDLLRPSVVLFLNVTEEVRKQRMNFRDEAMTYEEKILDTDALFRQRLCEAYKRMSDPACTEVDASGSREIVADLALSALKQHGVILT
ncbi:UMP-CMP kinase 2, mitochondrial-like [Haliotis asinina]|uniref:UMP-CMP kinase 2, mitochondrial-like n=1 Tax=Haliotis asinina TaxID=109174 RepID=UPI0035318901